MMPQPPYSPDLAPWDFFLFPKLKRPMKGRRYATLDEIKRASKEELKKIFLKWFEDWKNRWHKCIISHGDYFEGDKLDFPSLDDFFTKGYETRAEVTDLNNKGISLLANEYLDFKTSSGRVDILSSGNMESYYYMFSSLKVARIRSSPVKKTIGLLKNFKLNFVGHSGAWHGAIATIEENPGSHVWGLVWELPIEEIYKLDNQEVDYQKIYVDIETESGVLKCFSYQLIGKPSGMPSSIYKAVIIKGSNQHNFPEEYRKSLMNIQDNGYTGKVDIPINLEEIKDIL
ncbi:hypothetical protein LAZ67_2003869 [Cordylochernes scorpioides]|uniref:gamma-glutamylcyclotransferase n=1 Tax=Cordylochernes scorpioides TaxID=51811 RepID=A0ABY6K3C6_9ARAC|nr:hypothetical protein LAZ67_2003869 [Cordylochernes scorpioides]